MPIRHSSDAGASELPESSEATDFGIGLELDDPTAQGQINRLGVTTLRQTLNVASGFHVGYRLDLQSRQVDGSRAMIGSRGGKIAAAGDTDATLKANTWGFRLATDDKVWLGLLDGSSREVTTESGDYPTSRQLEVEFGVNNQSLMADTYQINLRYSLTPEVPSSPAILTSGARWRIGSDDAVHLTGINFNAAKIGIDLNKDNQLGNDELCRADSVVVDNNHFDCLPPTVPSSLSNEMHITAPIRMKWTDNTGQSRDEDSGQMMTYYVQPVIDDLSYASQIAADNVSLRVWNQIDLADVAQGGGTTWLLNNDGTVFQMGPNLAWDQTVDGTSDTIEADVVETLSNFDSYKDRIVSLSGSEVEASGDSVLFALSQDGASIYGQGSNIDNRMMVNGGGTFGKPHKVGLYRKSNWSWTRQIVAGDDFYVLLGKGADRPHNSSSATDRLGLYAWGIDDKRQLGDDDKAQKWPNLAPVPLVYSKDKITDDEYFAKIAVGSAHGLALTNTGRVVSWGYKGPSDSDGYGDGRLGWHTKSDAGHVHNISCGLADKDADYLPAYNIDTFRIVDIAAGDDFSAAVGSDGNLYAFGGMYRYNTDKSPIVRDKKFVAVSAKKDILLARTSAGAVYQVARDADTDGVRTEPILTGGVVQAFAGNSYSYFAMTDHRVKRVKLPSAIRAGQLYEIGDMTDYLRYPTYRVRARGLGLNYSGTVIWLDYNDNGALDDGEEIKSAVAIGSDNGRAAKQLKIETKINHLGTFKICVRTAYSDASCERSITIAQAANSRVERKQESSRSSAKKRQVPAPETSVGESAKESDQASSVQEPAEKLMVEDEKPLNKDNKAAASFVERWTDESNQHCVSLLISKNYISLSNEKDELTLDGLETPEQAQSELKSCVDRLVAADIIAQRVQGETEGFGCGASGVDVDSKPQRAIFVNNGQCFILELTQAALDALASQIIGAPTVAGGANVVPAAPNLVQRNVQHDNSTELVPTSTKSTHYNIFLTNPTADRSQYERPTSQLNVSQVGHDEPSEFASGR